MNRGCVTVLAALALAAGCARAGGTRAALPSETFVSEEDTARRAHLLAELQDDVLSSYERDDPPDFDTGMIDPEIGTARIGAGPGDVYIADDLARAPSRWPLDVDRATPTGVRSKRLEIQLAADLTAAWIADEVSWRIEMCGRTAVIPLRITALYAHDGDRWVPVFEHLSFGFPPAPLDAPLPRAIKTEVVSGDLRDELSGVLGRGLFRVPHDHSIVAQDPAAVVIGPDFGDEWHGAGVLDARLPSGKLEDRRVGTVGRTSADATVAYWIGNYIADVPARPGGPAGKARMRVTHVFEKRPLVTEDTQDGKPGELTSCARDPGNRSGTRRPPCRWMLVQSHMSQPVTDDELARVVFGTALISPKPLRLDCSEGGAGSGAPPAPAASGAPAAVPRRGALAPSIAPSAPSAPGSGYVPGFAGSARASPGSAGRRRNPVMCASRK